MTPSFPSFLCPASEPTDYWKRVIKTILKAKHIAVVCGEPSRDRVAVVRCVFWVDLSSSCLDAWRVLGAGISVQAGIPDFRSSSGLFQSLKKDNPSLSSGRDLFDASVFKVSIGVLGREQPQFTATGITPVPPPPSSLFPCFVHGS